MPKTLQQLCLQLYLHNISNTIKEMPPFLRDIVIDYTTDQIKLSMKSDIRKEIENEIYNDIIKNLPFMVTEIMCDITDSMNTYSIQKNFYKQWEGTPPELIKCAIKTAKVIYDMNHYGYNTESFGIESEESYLDTIDMQDMNTYESDEEESEEL